VTGASAAPSLSRPSRPRARWLPGPRLSAWLDIPNIRPRAEQIIVPLLASAALLAITTLIERLSGATIPLLLVLAVAITAWYDGVLVGVASVAALTGLVFIIVIPPPFTIGFAEAGDRVRMGTFAVTALITVFPMTALALFQTRNRRLAAEREVMIRELRGLTAAKDEFLGMVSHELRSPLTTILGNAEVLRKRWQILDDADRESALGDVAEESARLQGIVENLLLLARIEGAAIPEPEPIMVVHVVERVLARLRRLAVDREFGIVEHGEPRTVLSIPMWVERVVENFVSNAMKYSPRSEPITVDISRENGSVEVRVIDRGPGINEREATDLFEAFYRSKSNASKVAGIGIGLSVCKRLVETLGGEVWAKRRPDIGSEFGFRIPCVEIGEEDVATPIAGSPSATR
jgi:signal transduction histidine kinase